MSPATASRRRVIRRLIAEREIHSQQQLVDLLEEAGHPVTQATVSRDLDVIGAAKVRDEEGDSHYVLADPGDDDEARVGLARALAEFVEDVAASGNVTVLKTPPGAASVVAGAIDGAHLTGVLGTVAGDDTLIVVTVEHGARELISQLDRIGAGA